MSVVPAKKVSEVFGGAPAVAKLLGLSPVQVYRWGYPPEKGGHGGRVPTRHHPALKAAARALGKDLSDDDLDPEWLPPLGKPGPKTSAA